MSAELSLRWRARRRRSRRTTSPPRKNPRRSFAIRPERETMKTKRFLNLRKPRSAPSPRGAWRFGARRGAHVGGDFPGGGYRGRRFRAPALRGVRGAARDARPRARARTRSWTRSRRRSRRRRRSSSPSPAARSRRRSRFRGTWGKIRDPPKSLFAIRRATRWKVPSRRCGTRKIGVCGWRRSRGRRPRVPCAAARTGPPPTRRRRRTSPPRTTCSARRWARSGTPPRGAAWATSTSTSTRRFEPRREPRCTRPTRTKAVATAATTPPELRERRNRSAARRKQRRPARRTPPPRSRGRRGGTRRRAPTLR